MPVASDICPHLPKSAAKIAWMAARVAAGFDPFSPMDAKVKDDSKPGCIQPEDRPEVFALPRLRIRGVERDGKYYRARPFWLHRKHPLGAFQTQEGAEAVVRRFWIDTLGLFWMLGGKMGACIVEPDAPDVPPISPKPSGERESRRLVTRQQHRMRRPRRSRVNPSDSSGLFADTTWRENVAA